PGKRYPSAGELADDLDRFQAGQAIRARRVGLVERLVKWSRRHPAGAALLVLTLVAVAAPGTGVAVFTTQLEAKRIQAVRAEKKAEERAGREAEARLTAQQEGQRAEMARQALLNILAYRAWKEGEPDEAASLLAGGLARPLAWE